MATATPAKPSKKQQKQQQKPVPVKTSLTSPFSGPRWSGLPQEDQIFILETLRNTLRTVGLEKIESKAPRRWRKKKPRPVPPPCGGPQAPPPPSGGPPDPPPPTPAGWTVPEARRQLALGVNEVTRALEKDQLSLVLVCKSVKPDHMTKHLITLSRTREVPACQVPQLSSSVSSPLGLRTVLALGFHRDGALFSSTVEAIVPRVPPLHVDWIPAFPEERGARKRRREEVEDDHDDGKMDATDSGANKTDAGVSDRTAAMGEDAAGTKPTPTPSATPLCPLRELTVKKIVPNPLKKRKPKKEKKTTGKA